MYLKNLSLVPVNTETQALLQALREGRLFIQPASMPSADTRALVLSVVSRISDYAGNQSLVSEVWDALLQDDRIGCFRSRSGISPVNCYRIAATVRYMYELGMYGQGANVNDNPGEGAQKIMQKCRSAKQMVSFRLLCELLFPEGDSETYRRGSSNYLLEEYEQIISSVILKSQQNGRVY